MIILLIWVVVLIVVVLLYYRKVYSSFSRHGIKHIKPVPVLGNMGKLLLRREHFAYDIRNLYNSFPEERFVGRYEFIGKMVILRDVELVKKITVKDFEYFVDHRDIGVDSFFSRTLIMLRGQEWKDMRSTLSPAFTSSKIRLMVPFMVEVGDQMIRALKEKIETSGDGYMDVDCKDLTTRYSNDVIASCAFGLKVDSHTEQNNEFYVMGKTATNFKFRQLLMFFFLMNVPKIMKLLKWDLVNDAVKKFFSNLVLDTMKDREMRHLIRPDMIHLLMEAKKGKLSHEDVKTNDEAAGFATVEESTLGRKGMTQEWKDGDLVAQAFLFFVAGFETVSSCMSFLLYELAVNPEVQERLAQEIKEHDAKNGGIFDFNSIQKMTYLDMVISEALRKWPPAIAMDRVCNKDYNLGKPNDAVEKDYIIMTILLIWVVVLIAVVLLYFRQVYSSFSRHGIKHIKPVPVLGNMGKLLLRREHFAYDILNLHNSFPEERFLGRYEFVNELIILRDVELVKKITVKDFDYFIDHRNVGIDSFFSRTLFLLRGQEWKDMRSTLSPAFTSSKIRLMVPFMVEVGDQMIRALKEMIKASGDGYIDVDCKDLTTRYSNDVIASCAFGLKVDSQTEQNNEFYVMGKTATNFSFRQLLMFFILMNVPVKLTKLLKWDVINDAVKNFFKNLVLDTMKDREMRHIVRPDMIHLLMEAKKGKLSHEDVKSNDEVAGFATVEESSLGRKDIAREWKDDDLVAQAFLFFVAGFETVSSCMSFLLYELAVNPDVQERLVQEIKEHDAKNGGKFDFNSIQNMTYLDMVISEVLRRWPPAVAMDRVCNKDYNLGKPNDAVDKDYILRKGSVVIIPTFAFHHDPQYFPEPEKFDPERFSEENKHKINPLAYMPFGLGPRNCIGSRFALCEVKVIVYQLLRQMELSPCEKTCIPAKLSTDSFNIKLQGGHWLRFKQRQS